MSKIRRKERSNDDANAKDSGLLRSGDDHRCRNGCNVHYVAQYGEQKLVVSSFEPGMIGGTDVHNAAWNRRQLNAVRSPNDARRTNEGTGESMDVADLVHAGKLEKPQWEATVHEIVNSRGEKAFARAACLFPDPGRIALRRLQVDGQWRSRLKSDCHYSWADRGSGRRLRTPLAKTRQRGRAQGTHR
jgi:hypothetical protein